MTVAQNLEFTRSESRRLLAAHADKELLRFITCGSVDDGKSTLIGRLLLEVGAIYDDQISALQQDSLKHGTAGSEIDTALLLDGLEDERQQGITIDVAYRYFTTAKRKFIIADTPGHEQFTRNMVTGASTCDLAVILIDARKGLLTQTRRHAFIASLLGIQHVIVAVNKMDLVDFDKQVFDRIRDDFSDFAAKLDIPDIRFVPLSALTGDNVVEPSAKTLWYADGSLLHLLESVYIGSDHNLQDLRFPVQWVNRPDANFRGFSGKVASGTLRTGDEVMVLPSRKKSQVRRIVTMDGDLEEAKCPLSVTVVLRDEIDVTRGDMLVCEGHAPCVGREADAMLVWMSEQPLVPGKQYWFKHTTRRTSGEVQSIRYAIDVNTLHRRETASLKLNQIGRCRVALHDPVMFDPYRRNRQTGSFIIVDRVSYETVAAGMFLDQASSAHGEEHWDDEPASRRLKRAVSHIPAEVRHRRYGQQPVTLLLTGLSGSGKSTIALELEKRLFEQGRLAVVLDGQNMRLGISRDLGFTAEERSENLRRAAEIASLLNDSGLICIAAFVAPHLNVRQKVRTLIRNERFLHVHLSAPLAICRERDTTGRYLAADRHEITDFPGVTSEYQAPADADLVLATNELSISECVDRILWLLVDRGFSRNVNMEN